MFFFQNRLHHHTHGLIIYTKILAKDGLACHVMLKQTGRFRQENSRNSWNLEAVFQAQCLWIFLVAYNQLPVVFQYENHWKMEISAESVKIRYQESPI